MIRIHRNYDPATGEKGKEAIDICLFGFGVCFRWRSAADGTTPHWSITCWRNYRQIFSWTLKRGEQ